MSERWDEIDHYLIISSDSHGGADLYEYKDYLPSEWHEEFDAWAATYSSPWDDLVNDTADRNWDSDLRLSDMDADGVSAELIFPNTIPPFFESIVNIVTLPSDQASYDRRWAGLQAHNRWLHDFCMKTPGRRLGLVQVLPHDIDHALAEIKWAKETGAFGAALLPAIPPNHVLEPYYTDRYEPIWSLCEELDFTVNHHAGSGLPALPDHFATGAVMLTEFNLFAARTLTHLIVGGVFERHPDLRFAMTEQGIPDIFGIDRWFTMAEQRPWIRMHLGEVVDKLSMLPSEYFRRNCYVGASPGGPAAPAALEQARTIGLDRFMWGADYPHREATSPYSRQALRMLVPYIDDGEVRDLLAGTAAKVYGFDLEALTPVAKRIGPTVTELRTPLRQSEVPDDSEWFLDRAVGVTVTA